MKSVKICILITGLFLLTSCASQLAVKSMTADPAEVPAGQTAYMMVEFQGPVDQVDNVVATVREQPSVIYTLVNDGTNGDEEAGDRIWTVGAPVPYDAPPGLYHLDIVARDSEGNVIVARGVEVENASLSGTLEVTVR